MPTSIEHTEKFISGGHYLDTCQGGGELGAIPIDVGGTVFKTWNDKSTRLKPKGRDLLFSPTSQPLQSTRYEAPSVTKYLQGYAFGWCNGVPHYYPYYAVAVNNAYSQNELNPRMDRDIFLQIRNEIGSEAVNLGTSLAEYRATASMFSQGAKMVRQAFRIARGKIPMSSRSKFTACSISAAYLANSYGIQPLMADLADSYEAMRLKLELPILKKFIAYSKGRHTVADETNYWRTEGKSTKSERGIFYVEYKQNQDLLSVGNPASWLWEVIPYSFVVDWMIPIGDTLASLDVLRNTIRAAGTVTTKRAWITRTYTKYENSLGDTGESQVPGIVQGSSHERAAYLTVPLPGIPKWSPSTSYKSILNGLALLHQMNAKGNRGGCSKGINSIVNPYPINLLPRGRHANL